MLVTGPIELTDSSCLSNSSTSLGEFKKGSNKKMKKLLKTYWKHGDWAVYHDYVEDIPSGQKEVLSGAGTAAHCLDADESREEPKLSRKLTKIMRPLGKSRSTHVLRRTVSEQTPSTSKQGKQIQCVCTKRCTSRFCPSHYHTGHFPSEHISDNTSYNTYLNVSHRFLPHHKSHVTENQTSHVQCRHFHTHPRWGYTGGSLSFPTLNKSHHDELKGTTTDTVRYSDGAAVGSGGFFHSYRNRGAGYSNLLSTSHGTHGMSRSHYLIRGNHSAGAHESSSSSLTPHHLKDPKSGRILSTTMALGRGFPVSSGINSARAHFPPSAHRSSLYVPPSNAVPFRDA